MTTIIKPLIAACALALSLGGCALLSSPDPVQMYRFGHTPAAGPTAGMGVAQVALRRVVFPEGSGGDRLLGVTGAEAAYIGGARWVASSEDLFTQSLENAFGQSSRVRVIGRGEILPTASALSIEVRAFEARYPAPEAAPTVEIAAHARILDLSDRSVLAERMFVVSQPASANRLSSIVEAYDLATRDINTQIVAWTEANAPAA